MDDGNGNQYERLQASMDTLLAKIDQLTDRVEILEQRPPISNSHTPESPPVALPEKHETTQVVSDFGNTPNNSAANDVQSRAEELDKLRARLNVDRTSSKTPKRTKPKRQGIDLEKFEWMLGARGLALVGMFIVVIGVGMFLKMAVDEGWVAAIKPATRCWVSAAFGVLLVGVGEFLRRRINPLASSGVSAAGIAVMYASILAATRMYTLLETPVAFVLLVLVTIAGIMLGSLSNRVMLAILSLIGAFAVPVLLSTGEPSFVILPGYLIALLMLGLVLSGWRGGSYSHVRRLAWWGTGLIGSFWLKDMYGMAPTSSLVFVSLVWLATVAELIASSRFFHVIRDQTAWPEDSRVGFLAEESGELTFNPRMLFSTEARWINSLFGVSAWAVVASAMTLREINAKLDFVAPLGFAVLSIVIVVFVLNWKKAGLAYLRAQEASPGSLLASSMTINAVLLGVATAATALGGWIQVVAWVAIGFASIETAKRIRFRAAGLFGFAMLAVALGRLLLHDSQSHMQIDAAFSMFGLAFTMWSPQVLLVAAVCGAGAWRSSYDSERSIVASAVPWIIAFSLIHRDTNVDSYGAAIMVLAAVAGWASLVVPFAWLRISAYSLAAVGMGIALIGQFEYHPDSLITLNIDVVSMAITGLAWVTLAMVPKATYQSRSIFASLAIACGSIAIGSLVESHGMPTALIVGAIYTGTVAFFGVRLFRWSLMEIASLPLYVTAMGWMVHQVRRGDDVFIGLPIVNIEFLVSALLSGSAIWIGVMLPKIAKSDDAPLSLKESRRMLGLLAFVFSWILLIASTTIESERVSRQLFGNTAIRGAAISIWWSLFAIASVVLGFRLATPLRWAGLGLLGVVAVKVLLVDTVVLEPPARVVAAITVGLVIIASGVLYARLIDVVDPKNASETDPGPDKQSDD